MWQLKTPAAAVKKKLSYDLLRHQVTFFTMRFNRFFLRLLQLFAKYNLAFSQRLLHSTAKRTSYLRNNRLGIRHVKLYYTEMFS